jgi:hypothetical protein
MDRYAKYMSFLESLRDDSNSVCIDHIKEGVKAIYEGYADVVEHKEDALTRFNHKAAQISMGLGNNVQNFLSQSRKDIERTYSFTSEDDMGNQPYSSKVDLVVGGDNSSDDVYSMLSNIRYDEIGRENSENSLGDFSQFI